MSSVDSKKLERRVATLSKTLEDLSNRYDDKVRELSLLRRLGDSLSYALDLREACFKTLELLFAEFQPENCTLLLLDQKAQELIPFAVRSTVQFGGKKDYPRLKIAASFKVGFGAAGWAAEQKKIIYIPDAALDKRFVTLADSHVDIQSIACLPLLNGDTLEGAICLSHSKKNAFSGNIINLLNILMHDIGSAIGNMKLVETLKEKNRSLQQLNEKLHKAWRELHRTQQFIINSEKLSGISILAAGIAHEFNNILAGIVGYGELGLLQPEINEMKKNIRSILKVSDRASDIIKKLLAFAGRGKMKKSMVNLNNEIETILDFVNPEFEKAGIVIRTHLGAIPRIPGDINHLAQVMLHVISNARDAMESGGTLTITTRKSARWVEMLFEDTGTGIEQEALDAVFNPFMTTKGALGSGAQQGSGLGLSIAYGIVRSHNGEISIESGTGRGTKIAVRLPRGTVEIPFIDRE